MTDVSSILGEYMLKGWVLTDSVCRNATCNVPLMRSPNGRVPVISFCARCDGSPDRKSITAPESLARPTSPSISSASVPSRISTPPTELSSALSSPTFAVPVETEESVHRRQQSDRASAEIGRRLLKGWTMLAEECPSPSCYGTPLVRPPKAGSHKNPKMECVLCGTLYISAEDGTLPSVQADNLGGNYLEATTTENQDNATRTITEQVTTVGPSPTEQPPASRFIPGSSLHEQVREPMLGSIAFDATRQSINVLMKALSRRLGAMSEAAVIDPNSINATLDTMSKAMQILDQANRLYANHSL